MGGRRAAPAGGQRRQHLPFLLVRLARRGGGPLFGARADGSAARPHALVRRIAAVVLAAFLGLSGPSHAQERPPDPTDLINAVLGGLLGFKEVSGPELQAEVAEAGGIGFKSAVPLDYLSPADLA